MQAPWRGRPAGWHGAKTHMDIILHIGAHRTATGSLLAYLEGNAPALAAQGIAVWGPQRARGGVLAGVIPGPGPLSAARQRVRAAGRIALSLERAERQGARHLLISAPHLLGAPAAALRAGRLYPWAGARLAQVVAGFGGRLDRIVLTIRAPDAYWRSVIAMTVMQGHALPDPAALARLAAQPRSWQDLIAELAEAAPGVDLLVMPHERFAALPDRRLARMLARSGDPDLALPPDRRRPWRNRGPEAAALHRALALDGAPLPSVPWCPFTPPQRAALEERYHDDLFWLHAGAHGRARLATDPWPDATPGPDIFRSNRQVPAGAPQTGPHGVAQTGRIDPRARLRQRGQGDDIEEGRMGQAG